MLDPSFHRFHLGDQHLAFDFNIGPLPQQMHGLFAKTRFLHSHYQQTFEELVRYNFIENYMSSCFGPLATMQERFLATRLEEVTDLSHYHHLAHKLEWKQKIEIEDAITELGLSPVHFHTLESKFDTSPLFWQMLWKKEGKIEPQHALPATPRKRCANHHNHLRSKLFLPVQRQTTFRKGGMFGEKKQVQAAAASRST